MHDVPTIPSECVPLQHTMYIGMPPLNIQDEKQTGFQAGRVSKYYGGKLSHWGGFKDWVKNWEKSSATQAAFRGITERGEPWPRQGTGWPVSSDTPVLAEFFSNAIEWVRLCYHDMNGTDFSSAGFGGAKLIPKGQRVKEYEPDWAVWYDNLKEVRLVGETKSCVTAKIREMVECALTTGKKCNTFPLRGQIVEYMILYRTQFGFLSNYESTVFLMLSYADDDQEQKDPHIYFSDAISYKDKYNADPSPASISTRLGLLYIMHLCKLERELWQISEQECSLIKDLEWFPGRHFEIPHKYLGPPSHQEDPSSRLSRNKPDYARAFKQLDLNDAKEERDEQDDLGTRGAAPTPLHKLVERRVERGEDSPEKRESPLARKGTTTAPLSMPDISRGSPPHPYRTRQATSEQDKR
ncbi:hypothetical protein M011DRAFT_523275 [Sporormia fimetaria CBS 119925]|uniref:Uncharacterized protein n=1 Tax=Sporormia fimetaria CBS 119925 TaxID=1340428 RepID=A0A6A6VKU2_9PLEO|nr:hypothetical protein M011DRAFT_523275 [Sporormia fimetaria CBS 119925]